MIGALLNHRYRLDAELGHGGMGMVYRAHDTLLDRDVAVKVLSAAFLTAESRTRLLREARSAAQLNHPNIVSVYDAGEADLPGFGETVPYVVLELVEGPSLHERPPGSLGETLAVACQVCAALEHAHAHSIIHRDLKPENVLLALDGTAKLNDFGLARPLVSRLTPEGTIVGTVFYLAPELAMGKEIDGRTDLYALGVMLYELLTGELPFVGDDPIVVISQHIHAPVMPPRARRPEIPVDLDALIVQLLSKAPAERPGSASEVRARLGCLVSSGAPPDAARFTPASAQASVPSLSNAARVVLDRERARGEGLLDPNALALVYACRDDLAIGPEDVRLLVRSALQHGQDPAPWLHLAGSPEAAVQVLVDAWESYPKPPARLRAVQALRALPFDEATDALVHICQSDDAPDIRTEAALAAAGRGRLRAVVDALLADTGSSREAAAMPALVALADEFGLPEEAGPYPRLPLGVALAQRRLAARRAAVSHQALVAGLGAALAWALFGLLTPLFMWIASPKEFGAVRQLQDVPVWMLGSAIVGLVVGGLLGAAEGASVGAADALWRGSLWARRRLLFGGLAGLAHTLYLVLFALSGATKPAAAPGVYIPAYGLYGPLVGMVASLAIPRLGGPAPFRRQLVRSLAAAFVTAAVTVPCVYLLYQEQAGESLLSRLVNAFLLVMGMGLGCVRRSGGASPAERVQQQ
ncbi:MAG TPA: protein kinase [Anaerolineae bacterium]|nr:protein kinase [Anaerolineae bacterium]